MECNYIGGGEWLLFAWLDLAQQPQLAAANRPWSVSQVCPGDLRK